MRMGLIAVLAAAVLVAGCASEADPDYGPYPKDYLTTISAWFNHKLKDPKTATYSNWRGPAHGWFPAGMDILGRQLKYYGWEVCVDVNAKKSFGGYTGTKFYHFLIKDDQIIHWEHVPGPSLGICHI